jgi:tetratricopeptide (TPR) repeat protein
LVHALADPAADHQTASQHFSDWLFAETTGQPYFMAETVKMLVEHDILHTAYQHDGHWSVDFGLAIEQIGRQGELPMPPSVREVILTRLGRVSETAGALLVAGAILGQACSFEQLCQVSGIDELAGLPALDELVESQLLVEAADVQRPYTFSHDKIRDVVYAEAGEARRHLYHRRAFAELQTDAAPAAELAHHALAGRLLEPAFRYSVAAGDQAAGVYAHVEAVQHYRRALDTVKQDQAGESDEALTGLYLHLGRTLELMSRFDDALATYEEMERFAQARGDRAMEVAALLARITPLATVTAVFDPTHAERLAERALQLAQGLGDQAAEADILWNQLNIYRVTNRLPQAAACGERALALARRLSRRERLAFVLHDLGYCSAFMADFEPARALFHEAGALWREFGNLPMVADGLVGVCFVCVYSGEYDAAIASFEEALQISQTIDSLWALASCRHNIGYVFSDRGQVERAMAEMEEGIRLSEQDGPISPLIIVRADMALLYSALGAVERGLEIARRALSVAETKLPVFRVYPLAALGHLSLVRGNIAEAEMLIGQLKTDPNRTGLGIFPAMILLAEAELALAQGTYERARLSAEEAMAAAQQIGARAFFPSAFDLQAQAWLGLGQLQVARERWQEARREAEALGARRRLWPILLALSRLEADPTDAERLRQQAREVVAYIADHTPPDPTLGPKVGLRASFLNLPAVRAVFADGRP